MLTPTDTHYIAGLLTLTSSPADAEVEVGSMVPDVASEIDRDVDITIKSRNVNGQEVLLMGREVKAHRRPLDSTHVEQLAAKLNDMPSLTLRGIVSASGYTAPAIRKAAKHGIVLHELVELKDSDAGFDHFLPKRIPFIRHGYEWLGERVAHVNPRLRLSPEQSADFTGNPLVHFAGGRHDPQCPDLQTLAKLLEGFASIQLAERTPPEDQVPGRTRKVRVTVNCASLQAAMIVNGDAIPIEEVGFAGEVRWREEKGENKLMVLRRVGEAKPDAGCCVFEAPGWGLCGLVVSNTNRDLRFLNIPVSDRGRNKIYRQVLRHIVPAPAEPIPSAP